MKKTSYETMKKNSRLTDFEDIKDAVIDHRAKTKHIPKFQVKEETNKPLHLYI